VSHSYVGQKLSVWKNELSKFFCVHISRSYYLIWPLFFCLCFVGTLMRSLGSTYSGKHLFWWLLSSRHLALWYFQFVTRLYHIGPIFFQMQFFCLTIKVGENSLPQGMIRGVWHNIHFPWALFQGPFSLNLEVCHCWGKMTCWHFSQIQMLEKL